MNLNFFSRKIIQPILVGVFLILLATGFYLLYISRTGASLFSPWQTIQPAYIYCFAAITLVLGGMIFLRLPRRLLLFFFILYSFLLHSYLPLTHQLLYGADSWRHIADEARLLAGLSLTPASLAAQASAVGTLIGVISYWQLWFLTILIAKLTTLNLIFVNAWLLPVLWSIAFPVLFFRVVKELHFSERWSFVLLWLSAWPFALQTAGSFSLPVNLGFLLWLAAIVIMLWWLSEPSRRKIYCLIVVGLILTFGYALFAVLFWLSVLILVLLKYMKGSSGRWFLAAAGGLVIPAFELFAGYSTIDWHLNGWSAFKQLVGNFSGWYLADGPRPHVIASGNILFNQVPSYAFIPNWLTAWHWWIVIAALFFFSLTIYGMYLGFRSESRAWQWLTFLAESLFVSYVCSWYLLGGEHILARRLDVVLAFFSVIFFGFGLTHWLTHHFLNFSARRRSLGIASLLVLGSLAVAASYSLGPASAAVSTDQYAAMGYIWNQELNASSHCVLADTYSLLALEAISKRAIVGGGFPMDTNFGQPELARLYDQLTSTPTPALLDEALRVTGANQCWLALPAGQKFETKPTLLAGLPFQQFGKIFVWRYTK